MDTILKEKTEDLVKNLRLIKQVAKMIPNLIRLFLAFEVGKNQQNIARIGEIKSYIKRTSPWYSYFHSRTNMYLLCGLLLNESIYKTLFTTMFNLYQLSKPATTFGSPFLLFSSYIIAKSQDAPERLIKKATNYYQEFKKSHRFLTTNYNYVNASLLASFEDFQNVNEIEVCYNYLLAYGIPKNASSLSLAQLLMLSKNLVPKDESIKIFVEEVAYFYQLLRKNQVKASYYTLPILSLLPLVDANHELIASEIREVASKLATYKDCFGFWRCSKSNRILIATALVFDYYLEISSKTSPILTNQLTLRVILAAIISRKIQDEATAASID